MLKKLDLFLTPPARNVQTAPDSTPPEALEAVSEMADTTSEAALTLFQWISSGQREALIALAIATGAALLLFLARAGLLRVLPRLPRRDPYSLSAILRRMVERVRTYFILTASLLVAQHFVGFPEPVEAGIQIIFVLASVVQVAELVQEAVVSSIKRSAARNSGDAAAMASAVNVMKWLASVAIWSVALLLILDNIGADVTALLAGLGIGGVAIGLAAQGIFQDLFSALSIIFDRPFQRGDAIKYGDTWGRIEDIGLKTTRIRSINGEQIIISNTNLLDLEIHNMARMPKRRVDSGFGIVYSTHPDVADRVVGMVSKLVNEMDGVELECCNFLGFGDSSLDFELIFYSLNPDYRRSKAVTSKLLLAVFRMFHEEGIEFAFPTQTIHLASVPGEATGEIAGAVERSLQRVTIGQAA
ncbi:MAG: mechanosensitive ion channel domain-containing protein [Pseudomonadota bacterium]